MTEAYDDSDAREERAWRKEQEKLPPYQRESRYFDKPDCPYCVFAKKGGAIGAVRHSGRRGPDSPEYRHWVRITDSTTSLWTLDAACGATFKTIVDSGD